MTLPVDGRHVAETTLEVLVTPEAVRAVEDEIRQLQSRMPMRINPRPTSRLRPEPDAPRVTPLGNLRRGTVLGNAVGDGSVRQRTRPCNEWGCVQA